MQLLTLTLKWVEMYLTRDFCPDIRCAVGSISEFQSLKALKK